MTNPHAQAVEAAIASLEQTLREAYECGMGGPQSARMVATEDAITAYLAAMRAEGWVMVPMEPTVAMLQDGSDAYRATHLGGLSGMTIEAQTRAQCRREAACYAAMLKGAADE